MRERDSSFAIISAIILLTILCLNAHAGDSDRTVVRRAPPVYPEIARQMHIAGSVLLTISIAPDGSVSDVKVEQGHPILVDAAVRAVRKWKFALGAGVTRETVNVNFDQQ